MQTKRIHRSVDDRGAGAAHVAAPDDNGLINHSAASLKETLPPPAGFG
jgi:hypothetical protein